MRKILDLKADFPRRFEPIPGSGCWAWLGRVNHGGYGQMIVGRAAKLAHRVAYEMFIGPIPDGMVLDHLCRVRSCVNPLHLDPVTLVENVKRGAHATKKKCIHGHEYTEKNTKRTKTGRACKVCRNIYRRNLRARRKEEGLAI